MAYCTVDDLLIGDISTSAELSPVKYVNDAADEIDSKIGFRYDTPIPVSSPRPVLLLLKRLNSHLASGRLILAATISANQEELNAYGASLVNDAQLTLEAIASGQMFLPGAPANPDLPPPPSADDPSTLPALISNLDEVSQVEAFYDAATRDSLGGFYPTPYGTGRGYFPSPYRAASG